MDYFLDSFPNGPGNKVGIWKLLNKIWCQLHWMSDKTNILHCPSLIETNWIESFLYTYKSDFLNLRLAIQYAVWSMIKDFFVIFPKLTWYSSESAKFSILHGKINDKHLALKFKYRNKKKDDYKNNNPWSLRHAFLNTQRKV